MHNIVDSTYLIYYLHTKNVIFRPESSSKLTSIVLHAVYLKYT